MFLPLPAWVLCEINTAVMVIITQVRSVGSTTNFKHSTSMDKPWINEYSKGGHKSNWDESL